MENYDPCNQLPPDRDLLRLTDAQLREAVWNHGHGNCYYAVAICRKCGRFWTQPDGDARTAEIQKQCRECFDK